MESIDDQLACKVCYELTVDILETVCCHQLLCASCIACLTSCPVCRNPRLAANTNVVIKRMVGSLPATCECGYVTTREGLKPHEASSCPIKQFTCSVASCAYSGRLSEFLTHVIAQHPQETIKAFTSAPSNEPRDCIGRRGNARLGSNGKYYCGQRLNGSCTCCNGFCGPTNGCNCEACMRLDIEARALPPLHLVNKEGRTSRPNGGFWYCGAKVLSASISCDGWCGPSNGPQCRVCELLQRQVSSRYSSLVRY
jgi:hypothetical protein